MVHEIMHTSNNPEITYSCFKKIDLPANKGRNYGPRWEKLLDYLERIH